MCILIIQPRTPSPTPTPFLLLRAPSLPLPDNPSTALCFCTPCWHLYQDRLVRLYSELERAVEPNALPLRRIWMVHALERHVSRFQINSVLDGEMALQSVMYREWRQRPWRVGGPTEREAIQNQVFRARANVIGDLDIRRQEREEQARQAMETIVTGLHWRVWEAEQWEEEMWAEYWKWMDEGDSEDEDEDDSEDDLENSEDGDSGDSDDEDSEDEDEEDSEDEDKHEQQNEKRSLADELDALILSAAVWALVDSWR